MSSSIHRGSDIQMFVRNEDGTQTMLGEMQAINMAVEREEPRETPEDRRVMEEVQEHLREALRPYIGLEVTDVQEGIRDTATATTQSFIARRMEDTGDSFTEHRNAEDDVVGELSVGGRAMGGTLNINGGGITVNTIQANQLNIGSSFQSIGAVQAPPKYKVLPETVENTMDMIAIFRAMLEERPLILNQDVVERYNLHKYVKEQETRLWSTII